MNYYYKEKDWIYIGFEYNSKFVAAMKKFGAQYNYATKEWAMQLTLEHSFLVKGFIEENGFKKAKPILPREIPLNPIEEIVDDVTVKDLVDYLKLPLNLRDYQIEGLTYMINHENCVNGCSMGLGKSRQSIAYAELLNLFPCLVVCPSTVKSSWFKEWQKCNPKRTLHIIDSKDKDDIDWKADVTIINYDYLYKRGDSKDSLKLRYGRSLGKKWNLVIFDEIHLCKNRKSLRSKAVTKIANNSLHKLALSGTLIMNRPQELINILKILGQFNNIFPDERYYLYRYCNAKKTPFGLDVKGANNTMELHEIIKHYCYFRKERREVLTELPPIVEQNIIVPISNKKEYQRAEEDLISYLSEIDIEAAERAERAEHLVRLANLKRLSLKGKMKFLIQFFKDWQEADEENKIIIFGNLTEPLEELYKVFKKDAVLVTGKYSTTEKMSRVEEWKENKQFLFANIKTLSTGVDGLQQYCNNMAFIEWPVTPNDLEQAMARIDRMGQKNNMNIYHLLSEETVDKEIQSLIREKLIVTDAINKGIQNVSSSVKSVDWELLRRLKSKN